MKCELLQYLDKLHTTKLGLERITRNLSLQSCDAVEWCKGKVALPNANIIREGKNWYVYIDGCVITVNAFSYTIITAHKNEKNQSHCKGTNRTL